MRFKDRTDAGTKILEKIKESGHDYDSVFAVGRRGLPVAEKISSGLGAKLGIISVNYIGAPGAPELHIGAVAHDGTLWLKKSASDLNVTADYISRKKIEMIQKARNKIKDLNVSEKPEESVDSALLVSDGLVDESSVLAAIGFLKKNGVSTIGIAVPAASKDALRIVEETVDDVFVKHEFPFLNDVSECYVTYEFVNQEMARNILKGSPSTTAV